MNITIEPIVIGKKKYFTIQQMASIINKSDQLIYSLTKKGNAIRRMKSMKIVDRVLIPCTELTEFPFTYAGAKPQDNIYYYNEEGKIIE